MTAPTIAIEQLDPASLLVDLNLREAKLDKPFVASIKELGILQPVVAVRTAEGQVRVRMGHRRTLAAIQAGLTTIPVIIAGDEATDDAGSIARILGQLAENEHREGLNAADKVGAIAQLLDLGLTAGQVIRRTPYNKATVEAAQAVNGSDTARQAAAKHAGLDIMHIAAIAEFDGDDEAVKTLTESALA